MNPDGRNAVSRETSQPREPNDDVSRETTVTVEIAKRVSRGTSSLPARRASVSRETRETRVQVELALDGCGDVAAATGLGFLDHMLTALGRHARFDLSLDCCGDLAVDDHHTVEDCALALGEALDRALADRSGIARFGYAYAPLDEALTRVVVDFSGRPYASVALSLVRDSIGDVASENLVHFFRSLAIGARCTLHVDLQRGENDHHKVESAFKALALALAQAVAPVGDPNTIPSTKGVLA